jgi:putative ABC transport system permease protein
MDAQGWRWLDDFLADVRFGLASFRKSPSFTAVAVASLALGIGVNTAIFSTVNGLLLKPLPYAHPDRLVWIDERGRDNGISGVLGVNFVDWAERSRTLEAIAAYNWEDLTLTGVGEPERLSAFEVTDGFFRLLGTRMQLGRDFLPAEARGGGERVVILSHALWARRFGSDASVIGRVVRLNDQDTRVVGVLPSSFRFLGQRELWMPLTLDAKEVRGERQALLDAIARLKPGVTPQQATAELEAIRATYDTDAQRRAEYGSVQLTPLHDHLVGGKDRLLLILVGSVTLLLLIACANVANLMLARGMVRQKQLAIRAALGAGRLRLIRQLLTESALLALCGGACGIAVAWGLTRLLMSISPPGTFGDVTSVATTGIDARVLAFTLVVSLHTGVLFGLAPALQLSRPDLTSALKDGGRDVASPRQRTRQALLVAQVALAMVLLVGAGLLARSFMNLLRVEPGFRSLNLLTLRLHLTPSRYPDHSRRLQFQQQLLERVAAVPGVESVGAVTNLPLTEVGNIVSFSVDGTATGESTGPVVFGMVSADYFRAVHIRVRAGRSFDARDAADGPRVVILSNSLARLLFADQEPIGKHLKLPIAREGATIVGVVDDVKRNGLDKAIQPELYAPYPQLSFSNQITTVVRSAVAPRSLAAALRSQVRAIDPDQPVYDVMTMDQRLAESVAPRRFTLQLLGGFALLALLLASVGVYGVVAYFVTQRTREVGIRMALGARKADVLGLFLKQGIGLSAWGVCLGLLGALSLARVMNSLLFGITPFDPLTFLVVAGLLTAMVLAACWLPAQRATSVDPLSAVRDQ